MGANSSAAAVDSLLRGASHLPAADVELVLGEHRCRLLGGAVASTAGIMVACGCSRCGELPMQLSSEGGCISSLSTWMSTHNGFEKDALLAIRQEDTEVPLAAWLCAAAQHMGGAALVRKQLSIFWWDIDSDGPAPTVPPPPSQRGQLAEQPPPAGAWRAATVVGFDAASGVHTLKYHSDHKKQTSQVLLPLAQVHFARMPPPPGTPPRSVLEGRTPLPPIAILMQQPQLPHPQQPQQPGIVGGAALMPAAAPPSTLGAAPDPTVAHLAKPPAAAAASRTHLLHSAFMPMGLGGSIAGGPLPPVPPVAPAAAGSAAGGSVAIGGGGVGALGVAAVAAVAAAPFVIDAHPHHPVLVRELLLEQERARAQQQQQQVGVMMQQPQQQHQQQQGVEVHIVQQQVPPPPQLPSPPPQLQQLQLPGLIPAAAATAMLPMRRVDSGVAAAAAQPSPSGISSAVPSQAGGGGVRSQSSQSSFGRRRLSSTAAAVAVGGPPPSLGGGAAAPAALVHSSCCGWHGDFAFGGDAASAAGPAAGGGGGGFWAAAGAGDGRLPPPAVMAAATSADNPFEVLSVCGMLARSTSAAAAAAMLPPTESRSGSPILATATAATAAAAAGANVAAVGITPSILIGAAAPPQQGVQQQLGPGDGVQGLLLHTLAAPHPAAAYPLPAAGVLRRDDSGTYDYSFHSNAAGPATATAATATATAATAIASASGVNARLGFSCCLASNSVSNGSGFNPASSGGGGGSSAHVAAQGAVGGGASVRALLLGGAGGGTSLASVTDGAVAPQSLEDRVLEELWHMLLHSEPWPTASTTNAAAATNNSTPNSAHGGLPCQHRRPGSSGIDSTAATAASTASDQQRPSPIPVRPDAGRMLSASLPTFVGQTTSLASSADGLVSGGVSSKLLLGGMGAGMGAGTSGGGLASSGLGTVISDGSSGRLVGDGSSSAGRGSSSSGGSRGGGLVKDLVALRCAQLQRLAVHRRSHTAAAAAVTSAPGTAAAAGGAAYTAASVVPAPFLAATAGGGTFGGGAVSSPMSPLKRMAPLMMRISQPHLPLQHHQLACVATAAAAEAGATACESPLKRLKSGIDSGLVSAAFESGSQLARHEDSGSGFYGAGGAAAAPAAAAGSFEEWAADLIRDAGQLDLGSCGAGSGMGGCGGTSQKC